MIEPPSVPGRTWRRHLVRTYLTFDDRSLGAGRIALASILLLDLARRVPGLSTWYTNAGLLPNHTLLWQPTYDHALSLFYVASYAHEAAIGFVLCGIAYLMLLVGWRTRLAQVLSLVAVLSLHGRTLFVQNGGDVVLSELCLWTCFLPTGRRFAVDAWRIAKHPRQGIVAAPVDHDVRAMACLAILLQLATIYFFNGIQKTGETWKEGSAVHYVLQSDVQVTQLGVWLRPHLTPALSRLLTRSTVLVEMAAPVLILLPVGSWISRSIVMFLLIGLHAGFALFLNVGVFSPAMMAFLPNLLPDRFWDRVERTPFAVAIRHAAAQSYERLAQPLGTLARQSQDFLGFPPRAYDSPYTPQYTASPTRARRVGRLSRDATVLCLLLIAGTQLCLENPSMPAALRSIQPRWAHVIVNGLQLFQGWSMFTPDAPLGDRAIVVDGVLADGRHVDPLNEVARFRHQQLFCETTIPAGLGYNALFAAYTDRISDFVDYHGALSDWILRYPERTGRPQNALTSFTVSLVENDSPRPGTLLATNPRATVLFRYPPGP